MSLALVAIVVSCSVAGATVVGRFVTLLVVGIGVVVVEGRNVIEAIDVVLFFVLNASVIVLDCEVDVLVCVELEIGIVVGRVFGVFDVSMDVVVGIDSVV